MRDSHRGFSLLEVLVAFVMLATLVTLVMRVTATSLRGVSAADQQATAVQLIRNEFERLGTAEPILPGASIHEVTTDWQLQRQVTEANLGPASPRARLYLIEVTALHDGRAVASLSSYRLGLRYQ